MKYLYVWSCSLEGHLGLFADGQEVRVDVPLENGHRLANVLGAEVSSGVDPEEGKPRGHHDEEPDCHEEVPSHGGSTDKARCPGTDWIQIYEL